MSGKVGKGLNKNGSGKDATSKDSKGRSVRKEHSKGGNQGDVGINDVEHYVVENFNDLKALPTRADRGSLGEQGKQCMRWASDGKSFYEVESSDPEEMESVHRVERNMGFLAAPTTAFGSSWASDAERSGE